MQKPEYIDWARYSLEPNPGLLTDNAKANRAQWLSFSSEAEQGRGQRTLNNNVGKEGGMKGGTRGKRDAGEEGVGKEGFHTQDTVLFL